MMSHNSCTYLTGCWWGVEVDFLAVLSEPRLVAASHPEHIHAVYLQPVHHSVGPSHFVQTLPCCGGVRGSDAAPRGCSSSRFPLVLDREVPSRGRVLRESPAQEELVVSERLLSVDYWS